MNREAQAIVLLLLGGALLHAGSTDLYLRYVQAGLRPLLLAAGVVLVLGAIATLWYGRRRSLPLFALILVGPPALGSYSAMRTGTALQQPLFLPPLAADGPLELSVVDYAGLFPPAGLDMRAAVGNYARYAAGPWAWALGRFIVPVSRLEELERAHKEHLRSHLSELVAQIEPTPAD